MSPWNVEALLTDSDWMRALARRLVHDSASAEDLVQDALVVAMSRPARPSRAYLASVLRNLSTSRFRSESRRIRREAAVARPERGGHEPGDSLAKVEAQRRLAEAVLGLDEPYRDVLVLRYTEGLTPDQVARQLHLPLGTVHSRLKRAVERLRARLDREDADWRLALNPLIGQLVTAERAMIPLARRMLLGAALVVLSTGVAVLALRGSSTPKSLPAPGSLDSGKTAIANSPLSRTSELPPARSVPDDSAGDRTETASHAGWWLALEVVDESGTPQAGAAVQLVVEPRGEPSEVYALGTTDVAGRLANDTEMLDALGLASFENVRAYLNVVHPTAGCGGVALDLDDGRRPQRMSERVTLTNLPLWRGRATTTDGTPCVAAEIAWISADDPRERERYAGVTDELGAFQLPAARPNGAEPTPGRIVIESAMGRFESAILDLSAAQELGSVHLDPGARCAGRVTLMSGHPARGVRIELRAPGSRSSSSTTSDAEGRFEFAGLTAGEAVLSIRVEGLAPIEERFQLPRTDLEFQLDTAWLEIRAEDDRGRPLRGLELSVRRVQRPTDIELEDYPDHEKTRCLGPDAVATLPIVAGWTYAIVPEESADHGAELLVTIPAGATLQRTTLQLADEVERGDLMLSVGRPDGSLIHDLEIDLFSADNALPLEALSDLQTDSTGRLRDLPAGRYLAAVRFGEALRPHEDLWIGDGETPSVEVHVAPDTATRVVIPAEPAGRLEVALTVRAWPAGAWPDPPVPDAGYREVYPFLREWGVFVELTALDGQDLGQRGALHWRSAADGAAPIDYVLWHPSASLVSLECLPVGRYEVRLRGIAWKPQRIEAVVHSGATGTVAATLERRD